jgi:hypothetical protein
MRKQRVTWKEIYADACGKLWTASVANARQDKDVDLGKFIGTRAHAAKQAVEKIPADFPATMLYLNNESTEAEYLHWLRGKRADLVVERWTGENDEERSRYYAAYYRDGGR